MDKINKKRLKQHYLDNPPAMGVYSIRNLKNGRRLIGVSKNIPGIFNRLKLELNNGKCRNTHLAREWDKFGESSFSFEILEELEYENQTDIELSKDLKTLLALYEEKFNKICY